MKKVLVASQVCVFLFCLLFFAFNNCIVLKAQERAESATKSGELTLDVRQKTFDLVWQKVADNFYDPNFKGTDWNAVRTKYLAEAEKTSDTVAFHTILNRMVKEIKESHLSVNYPGDPQTDVGLKSLVWAENKILVKKVDADSPASEANIQAGDQILAVDGLSVEEIYRQSVGKMIFESAELLAQQRPFTVERKLRGVPNSAVTLKIRDRQNKQREVVLKRKTKSTHGKLESTTFRRLTPTIGYIQIPSYWWGDLKETFDKAFHELSGCTSLIVDVRGNSGGQSSLLVYFVGRLMEKDGSLAELIYRDKKKPLAFKGTGEKAFKGKVIVLIDETSASASEIFAGGLRDLGRAEVVGNRSGGAVILSKIEDLPTGGSLLYPIADVYTSKGTRIEGNGVKPDIEIKRTRRSLIENHDIVLEKALAIASKN